MLNRAVFLGIFHVERCECTKEMLIQIIVSTETKMLFRPNVRGLEILGIHEYDTV